MYSAPREYCRDGQRRPGIFFRLSYLAVDESARIRELLYERVCFLYKLQQCHLVPPRLTAVDVGEVVGLRGIAEQFLEKDVLGGDHLTCWLEERR